MNDNCSTTSTNTMIQGRGINVRVVKESTKDLKAMQDTIKRLEDLLSFTKENRTKDDNSEQTVPSRRSQVEPDPTPKTPELAQDEFTEPTPLYCKPYQLFRVVDPKNLETLNSMGGIEGLPCGVGMESKPGLSTSHRHDAKESTKTRNNGDEKTAPLRRSRVEIEDDLDDDELHTIARGLYSQRTEVKFSSFNDPPRSDPEPSTTVDDKYYIYQTPTPTKQQWFIFPGIVQYLPCWSWLPSWGGWGSWIASWTATWVTPRGLQRRNPSDQPLRRGRENVPVPLLKRDDSVADLISC